MNPGPRTLDPGPCALNPRPRALNPQLPRPHDVREMLRNIAGQFCFVILDVRKDFILAACSEVGRGHGGIGWRE